MMNERFTNPFPGLRPFESNEDHLFFGRDGQSDELLRRLRRSRFLAVLGTSGSGKSSLVRAGMLPSLFGGLMTQAGSDWRVALFRPGHDPIGNLASALASPQVLGSDDDDAALQKTIIEATLRRSALGLVEATRQARMPAVENLLVVVDQFEEIFRFRRMSKREGPEDEAAAFIKLLLEAKRQTDVPVYIVITMRSDFLGDCAQFRDLPEAINDGQYLIPRMTRDQRREAITGPVAVGGGEISGRLVNRLLNDVGDDPDHLPILQHALMRTWELWEHDRRNGEPIDLRHYESVGTMTDALSRHADEAFAELPGERSRALAEKIFKSLTEKGPDNREVRRPTKVSEIAAIAEATPQEVIAVIEPFRQPGRSFLMPPAGVPLTADSLIDISHESLIRGWARLRKWVDEEARSANIYRRITDTAILHREGRAGLWHDPDLALALRWRAENRPNAVWGQHYHPEFDLAMNFIDASKTANEAEIAAREQARKKEVRRTRIFATILGIAFLTSLGFLLLANTQRVRANAALLEVRRQKGVADQQKALAEENAHKAQEAAASEKSAKEAAEKSAEAEKVSAEKAREAQAVAEEQRKQADAATVQAREAQAVAEQQKKEAQRSAQESLRAAMRVRKQSLTDKTNINTLAERVIQLSTPEEAAYWRNYYATALAEIGRSDLSKNESTKVLEVFGDNVNALTNRGYMSLIRFDTQQALKDFQRVREIDPQYSLNYLNLGVTEANLKNYDAAETAVQQAIQWYRPGYFDGVFDSEVSEDIKQATQRNVIYADGNEFNAALYYELAAIEAFRGGRDFEAKVAAADENAARTNPSVEGYLTALNWAWLQQRKEEKDYGAYAVQAHLWRRAGYPEWAGYYLKKFDCEHNDKKDLRYAALASWVNRQWRELPNSAKRVDCGTPPIREADTRTQTFLANELASIGKYREAVGLLDPAIERDPDNVELLLARARYRERAGYWARYWKEEDDAKRFSEGSRQDFEKLLKLADQNPAYKSIIYLWWSFLGPALGGLEASDVAKYSEEAIKLGPANAGALAQLSSSIAATDPEKAIELLKRSLALDPSPDNYRQLAALQNQTGRYRDALHSIDLAIALSNDRSDFYEERERSEKGLAVSEVERQRHLASGYATVADMQLKQERRSEAYVTYLAALKLLSAVEQSDSSGAVKTDEAVVGSKLDALLDKSREKISARILSIKDGEGKTREVTIDRGSDDGFKAGDEGSLWTVYSKTGNKERKVQKIGASQVKSVAADSGVVVVTMDDPKDDKLVRVGDMVEIDARVPPLNDRSALWRLARYHISFASEDGERIFSDYRKLYREENSELVNRILAQMRTEITRQALRIGDNEIMKTVIKNGRYKDKTLKQVLENPTNDDLLAMMAEMLQYPATYYGKDLKIVRTFAAWVLDEPK